MVGVVVAVVVEAFPLPFPLTDVCGVPDSKMISLVVILGRVSVGVGMGPSNVCFEDEATVEGRALRVRGEGNGPPGGSGAFLGDIPLLPIHQVGNRKMKQSGERRVWQEKMDLTDISLLISTGRSTCHSSIIIILLPIPLLYTSWTLDRC